MSTDIILNKKDLYYTKFKNNKISCPECNIEYNIYTKSNHNKSKRHLKNVEENKNKEIEEKNQNTKLLISKLIEEIKSSDMLSSEIENQIKNYFQKNI